MGGRSTTEGELKGGKNKVGPRSGGDVHCYRARNRKMTTSWSFSGGCSQRDAPLFLRV